MLLKLGLPLGPKPYGEGDEKETWGEKLNSVQIRTNWVSGFRKKIAVDSPSAFRRIFAKPVQTRDNNKDSKINNHLDAGAIKVRSRT